jgi:hypothetical protein
LRSTPGLQLANAFGVIVTAGKRHSPRARICQDNFRYWPTIKISIKNDSKTLIFTPIRTGIQVVLETPDTSRSARLTNGRKPMARAISLS